MPNPQKNQVTPDKLLDNVISDEVFQDKLQELELKRDEIRVHLSKMEYVETEPVLTAKIITKIVSKSALIYQKSEFYHRRELLENVFQGDFYYAKGNDRVRTFSDSSIIELINRLSVSYGKQKTQKKPLRNAKR